MLLAVLETTSCVNRLGELEEDICTISGHSAFPKTINDEEVEVVVESKLILSQSEISDIKAHNPKGKRKDWKDSFFGFTETSTGRVGLKVGALVGKKVGLGVGFTDGRKVGRIVGYLLGLDVECGDKDGRLPSWKEGCGDCTVFLNVGAAVG